MRILNCAHCREVFVATNRGARKYCSKRCCVKARNEISSAICRRKTRILGTRACKFCGETFQVGVGVGVLGRAARYCSQRCKWDYALAAKRRELRRINCAHCGIVFLQTVPYQKFCSPQCKQDAHRVRRRAINWKKAEAMHACKHCGTMFRKTSFIGNWVCHRRLYCSPKCRDAANNASDNRHLARAQRQALISLLLPAPVPRGPISRDWLYVASKRPRRWRRPALQKRKREWLWDAKGARMAAKARMAALTTGQRSELARQAALVRWHGASAAPAPPPVKSRAPRSASTERQREAMKRRHERERIALTAFRQMEQEARQ